MILTMTKALEKQMKQAESYQEWREAAIAHDKRSGAQDWKDTERSKRYDYRAIKDRLAALRKLRADKDNPCLLFTLNEGIHGNLGGMGRSDLYQNSKFGTKTLIAEYIEEVASALDHLAKPRVKGVSTDEKNDFFHRAQLCFGSSALLMSGAGTYLFFHLGVLKSLWEQDLIPQVLSGSSGGAFIAALVGTRAPEELGDIFKPEFIDIEDDVKNLLEKFIFFNRSQLRQADLQNAIAKLIPDLTFAEAYELSGFKINISIAPAEKHQKSRLLNAITSPNVMIREAVQASCSVPGIYDPVTLAARDVKNKRVPYLPNRKWVDGSVSDDLPMKRLSRLYAVNHFIVSQTNPIVLPFISAEKNQDGWLSTISQTSLKTMKDWGLAASHLAQRPFDSNSYVSKLINGYISVVSQTYTGDINILPSSRFLNPAQALASRTEKEISDLIEDGERATWPQIEKIRLQTKVSRKLDSILQSLEGRPVNKNKRNLKLVNKA